MGKLPFMVGFKKGDRLFIDFPASSYGMAVFPASVMREQGVGEGLDALVYIYIFQVFIRFIGLMIGINGAAKHGEGHFFSRNASA